MAETLGIVGAGVAGRLLALEMARRGWRVTLFDRVGRDGQGSCTWVGAGMLAPYCELVTRDLVVCELGVRSLSIWEEILPRLPAPVFFRRLGSLVVAHVADRHELDLLRRTVAGLLPDGDAMRRVDAGTIDGLEPELAGRFAEALYFPTEGQVCNRELLHATRLALEADSAITWRDGTAVAAVAPRRITLGDGTTCEFDAVADCRGLGAKPDLPDLRGVRGELLWLHAPEVHLSRPVRLMHPRYSIYIVPRRDQRYVVGATQIESEDDGPATVRSTLELLSAAYTVHSGFAEAQILELITGRRPAFGDNLPHLDVAPGFVRLNGLFRHGFLIAPALTRAAADHLCGTPPGDAFWHEIVRPYAAR